MNIRTVMYKAANSIEQNPEMFSFVSIDMPGCGMPGCALGWIAYHVGGCGHIYGNGWWSHLVEEAIGCDSMGFYDRMNELTLHEWKNSAPECAKALRLYADKYYPFIPDNVLAIFKPEKIAA